MEKGKTEAFKMKQVIAVRRDLKMGRGKMSAQVAHASVLAYEQARKKRSEWVEEWERSGSGKIVVWVANEEELLALQQKVRQLPNALVRDAGRTQLEPGTITCLGIGPAPDTEVDKYTKRLKLA